MKKKILVLMRQAPYGSSLARDGLDYILTSAAYDQDITILFLGDGVWQLLKQQNGKSIYAKTHSASLEVLPMYDIESLYVLADDLAARQLGLNDLIPGVEIIEKDEFHQIMNTQDSVIGF